MYGLIGRIQAVEGRRHELVEILLEGITGMPGCLSYIVATDPDDEDGIWITEVWDSRDSHEASLLLPTVREAIERGQSLIAGFERQIVTTPMGGHGLVASD